MDVLSRNDYILQKKSLVCTNLLFSLTISEVPQSDLQGPLELAENTIPVLESCELSRNEEVQRIDLQY